MTPLFDKITSGLCSTLLERGVTRRYAAGESIFEEGDNADFLPIVLSGIVKMLHYLEPGREVIVGIFQDGEMFALPPVVDGKAYPASAAAMAESELLLLGRGQFLRLLEESPEFSFAVISWLSEMLREKTAAIQNLSRTSPEHRVITVLLKLAERNIAEGPVKIAFRREDIARMAGLTTETTIRVVRKLAAKDLLDIVHGKIVISDPQPLRLQLS